MGTQSNLYVEKEDGGYIGVFCRYDGYPEHMIEEIEFCDHGRLYELVLVAGTRGGFRLFAPSSNETEYLKDEQPSYVYDPEDDGALGVDYIYVMHLDGTVKWRRSMSDKWIVA